MQFIGKMQSVGNFIQFFKNKKILFFEKKIKIIAQSPFSIKRDRVNINLKRKRRQQKVKKQHAPKTTQVYIFKNVTHVR